jgi:hypothetical protein
LEGSRSRAVEKSLAACRILLNDRIANRHWRNVNTTRRLGLTHQKRVIHEKIILVRDEPEISIMTYIFTELNVLKWK